MPHSRGSRQPPVANPLKKLTPPSQLSLLLRQARQYHGARELDKAVATCEEILGAYPNRPEALLLLAEISTARGRPDEAIESLRRAIALNPRAAGLHAALGNAQFVARRLDDAIASYRQALALDPRLAPAHNNLGNVLKQLGRLDEAIRSYQRGLALKRASRWYGWAGLSGLDTDPPPLTTFWFVSKSKLRHDIDQFLHLRSRALLPPDFDAEIAAYEQLSAELEPSFARETFVRLSPVQRSRIGRSYNRVVYLADTPELAKPAINPGLDRTAIEAHYRHNTPGVTWFDDFLTPEALAELQRFCCDSTIWFDFKHPGGYLGAYINEGFNCSLLLKIADDLRTALPGILGRLPLTQMWAYKYDHEMSGIGTHADPAVVNVNFWITPDSANLDPDNGGLIVHRAEAPREWDFQEYNNDPASIARFLAANDAGRFVVPYRQNRAVVFNSNLFHATDRFRFRSGYLSRRINITMLFGSRDATMQYRAARK
jgi:tetratricopeptide (TPR) repeat protein